MQLWLAPTGAGKTYTALQAVVAQKQRDPIAPVWVLVATERQVAQLRPQLLKVAREQLGTPGLFNIEFFTFYPLYHRLLALAGAPERVIDEAARLAMLREVAAETECGPFAPIAATTGFLQLVAALIYEFKQNLITPDQLAQTLPAHDARGQALARLYAAYSQRLRESKLVDREGEGWVALELVAVNPDLVRDVPLLVVDGYDQFHVLQARLLARLSDSIPTLVTLTTLPGRESSLGARFTLAGRRLDQAHREERSMPLHVTVRPAADHDARPAALREFSETLFVPGKQVTAPAWDAAQPARPPAIEMVEAPDQIGEVGAVLRRVKALLLDGHAPDSLLIALRDYDSYAWAYAALGRAYGLPLALAGGSP
jgi:ATP-dependent helicase/DNAse subunit B